MRAQRKSGKTMRAIAAESGLASGATLHEKLKSARIDRDLEWLKKTAKALGVTPAWLAFGEGSGLPAVNGPRASEA